MDNFNQNPPEPLTPTEQAHYRALALKETPTLEITRRFIATIRKSITSSPQKTEKTKVSRNKKTIVNEDQFEAF